MITTDGGRAAAGFKGATGDCVVRAIAIATQLPYEHVYMELNSLAKQEKPSKRRNRQSSSRTGVHRCTYEKYLKQLGWEWKATMAIGTGCQVHLRADELPSGRIICRLSRHLVAVIDGEIHDTHDPSRGGTRCVYGYLYKPPGV
jgi:hypothetical protein